MKALRCANDEVQYLTLVYKDNNEFELEAVGKKENSLRTYYEYDVAIGMFEFKKECLSLKEVNVYQNKYKDEEGTREDFMKKDIAKIIDELIGSHDDLKDMYYEFEGNNYSFKIIDGENWEGNGKYQTRYIIGELMNNEESLNIYYGQGQTRVGSYFTEYEVEFEDSHEIEKYEEMVKVTKWKVKGE